MSPSSFFNLTRVVAKAFGADIEAPEMRGNVFYSNKTLAFGQAGYLKVTQIAPWRFEFTSFDRVGKKIEERAVDLSDLGAAEDYATRRSPPVFALSPRSF
jgi:hypothetical protein